MTKNTKVNLSDKIFQKSKQKLLNGKYFESILEEIFYTIPNIFGLPHLRNCPVIPHVCHLDHLYIGGEKIGHVEKFQISIHNRCGEIRNFARFGGISKFYT